MPLPRVVQRYSSFTLWAPFDHPAVFRPRTAKSPEDAAAKVLDEQGKPMNCHELIDEMSRRNYWTSPNGATPQATLYAAIMREVKTKGKDARFVKTERGKFAGAEAK